MTPTDLFWLATLLTATALSSGAATGRRPRPLAPWLVPLPALAALAVAPAWASLPGIALALFVGAAWRNRGVLPVPTPAFLVTMAVSSAVAVIPLAAHHLLAPTLPDLLAPLLFPAVLVLIEYAGARGNPFGTWGTTAYTQRRNLPLLQLASITGLWGIAFLVVWPATALVTGLERGLDRPGTQGALVISLLAVVVVHLAGARRLATAPDISTGSTPAQGAFAVAALSRPTSLAPPEMLEELLTTDLRDPARAEEARNVFRALQDHLLQATADAARGGARLVVWPEADAPCPTDDATLLLDRIRETAKRHEVHVVAGIVHIDPDAAPPSLDNHVVLVDPAGDVRSHYRKAKLVPGFEAALARRGDTPPAVVETELGRIATAICFDLDFPEHMRTIGEQQTDLLLAPAGDWPAIDHLHADMAAFRAVENGVTLVRAARWGRSEAVDPFGRTLATADHVNESGTTMLAVVPAGGPTTSHHRYGSLVPAISAGILVLALVARITVAVIG